MPEIKEGDIVQYRPIKTIGDNHPMAWKVGIVNRVFQYGDEKACDVDMSSYRGEIPEAYLHYTCYIANLVLVCRPTENRSAISQS